MSEFNREYMMAAFGAAQSSTCARRRVGAVIVNPELDFPKSFVSSGWNHAGTGISCEAKFFSAYVKDVYPDTAELRMFLDLLQTDPLKAHEYEKLLSPELSSVWESFKINTKTPEFKKLHREWQDTEIHSELTAIMNAYKAGKSVANCILYSSRSPCVACAHAIIESGIKKVYYTQLSEAGEGGIPVLEKAGVEVEYMDPTEFEKEFYT